MILVKSVLQFFSCTNVDSQAKFCDLKVGLNSQMSEQNYEDFVVKNNSSRPYLMLLMFRHFRR